MRTTPLVLLMLMPFFAAALWVSVYFGSAAGLWAGGMPQQPPDEPDLPHLVVERLAGLGIRLPPGTHLVHVQRDVNAAGADLLWAALRVPDKTVLKIHHAITSFAGHSSGQWSLEHPPTISAAARFGCTEPPWWSPYDHPDADTLLLSRGGGVLAILSARSSDVHVLFFPASP